MNSFVFFVMRMLGVALRLNLEDLSGLKPFANH